MTGDTTLDVIAYVILGLLCIGVVGVIIDLLLEDPALVAFFAALITAVTAATWAFARVFG